MSAYIVSKAAELGVYVYAINGWTDHVHLVGAMPPKRSVAVVVKMLKGASSHYVNQERLCDGHFIWQEGYGVFSLGDRRRATTVNYVRNQKTHHRESGVNAWPERSERVDEGPADRGLDRPVKIGHLREEPAVYQSDDDLPF